MKVGDKVRFRADADMVAGHKLGDVGTIDHPDDDAWIIDVNGSRGWYMERELEVISSLPDAIPFGVSPDQLSEYFDKFVREAKTRITSTGARQYYNGQSQKFEHMSPLELVGWAREESQDCAVYAAMLDIRLARVAEVLKGVADAA